MFMTLWGSIPEEYRIWVIMAIAVLAALLLFMVSLIAVRVVQERELKQLKWRVSDVFVYPVKGSRAVGTESSTIDRLGFQHDRRFVIVERTSGKFISQRRCPALCQMHAVIQHGGSSGQNPVLELSGEGMKTLQVPFHPSVIRQPAEVPESKSRQSQQEEQLVEVDVWGAQFPARHLSDQADHWVSRFIAKARGDDYKSGGQPPFQLACVRGASTHCRKLPASLNPTDADQRIDCAFADSAPFLLITSESVAQLNRWVAERHEDNAAVQRDDPCLRIDKMAFRANIVVDPVLEAQPAAHHGLAGAMARLSQWLCPTLVVTLCARLASLKLPVLLRSAVRAVHRWLLSWRLMPDSRACPGFAAVPLPSLGFVEDRWATLMVAGKQGEALRMHCVHAAGRCVMTTVDPETGLFNRLNEPLSTLRQRRALDTGKPRAVFFGNHLTQDRAGGTVAVGDLVTVERWQPQVRLDIK